MKNAINYTSLPTTSNGTLKAGVWPSLLNQELVEGNLKINAVTLPNTIEVTVNGTLYNPEPLALILAGFGRCYKGEISIEEHVKLASEGFIIPLQKNTVVTDKATKTPFGNAKSVLTAAQYKVNCVKLGLDVRNVGKVAELVDTVYNITDKTSKADLTHLLTEFANMFLNPEQSGTYSRILEAEELAAKRFESLTAVGFTDIKEVANGHFNASVSLSQVAEAMPVLHDSGFTFIGSTMSGDFQSMAVSFKETV